MSVKIERQSASQAHLWKLAENEYVAQANNVLIGLVTGNVQATFSRKSLAEQFLTRMGFESYNYAVLMD